MPKSTPYAFILPDECLQHQTCSKCKKYLSCGPVKTYHFHDGAYDSYEVRCGRCVTDNDGGAVSTINKLFENAWFPCVNRLEGCNSLVAYKLMKAHENICKGTSIACPICACAAQENAEEYSLMALINHFKSRHLKNFLDRPLFNITQDVADHLLHYDTTKNILVLVTVKFKDKALVIKTLSSLRTGLKQKITIYNSSSRPDDSMEIYTSNFFNCKGIGDTSEGLRIPIALIEQCRQLLCCMEFDLVGHKVQHIDRPELGAVSKAFADESGLIKSSRSCEERRELPEIIPRIRRDEVFETFSETYILSDDHTEVITVGARKRSALTCSMCQNFFMKDDYVLSCRNCSRNICTECRFPARLRNFDACAGTINVQHCWFSGRFSKALRKYFKLNFYCKFNCGEYFSGKELVEHQDICQLNKNKGLIGKEKIARYFGVTIDKNHDRLQQHNLILISRNSWKPGKIYVVTKGDIFFMVDYKIENDTLAFKVVHGYDNVNVFVKCYSVSGSFYRTPQENIYKYVFPKEISSAAIVVILQKKN